MRTGHASTQRIRAGGAQGPGRTWPGDDGPVQGDRGRLVDHVRTAT